LRRTAPIRFTRYEFAPSVHSHSCYLFRVGRSPGPYRPHPSTQGGHITQTRIAPSIVTGALINVEFQIATKFEPNFARSFLCILSKANRKCSRPACQFLPVPASRRTEAGRNLRVGDASATQCGARRRWGQGSPADSDFELTFAGFRNPVSGNIYAVNAREREFGVVVDEARPVHLCAPLEK